METNDTIEGLRRRLEESERQGLEQQRRADAAEQQTQPTTLDEYIAFNHELVFANLHVETDPGLTSKGALTNPRDKRIIFGRIYAHTSRTNRAFESRHFLATLGRRIAKRPISDEKTLEYFMHNCVEDPVRAIVDEMKETNTEGSFALGKGIVFENHPHAISETSEEVVDADMQSRSHEVHQQSPPRTPDHRRDLHRLRPDQICVYRSDETPSRRTMVFVAEYKAPHKLTVDICELVYGVMNIHKEVVNRKTIPTSADPDGQFLYHAERLTASALTQTYHYMMEAGLTYGLLTTGVATVFLKVDWAQPATLYYHMAEPELEVATHPDDTVTCSALGQYLAFSLLALGQPGQDQGHGQDERQRAMDGLPRWAEDFETTLRSIPKSERTAPDSSPEFEPTTDIKAERSPIMLRGGRRPRPAS